MSDKLVEARRLLKESWIYTDRAMRISYIQDTIRKILEYLENREAEE